MKNGGYLGGVLLCIVFASCFSCDKSQNETISGLKALNEELVEDSLVMSVAEWEKKLRSYIAVVNDFAKTTHSGEEIAEFQSLINDLYGNIAKRDSIDLSHMTEACKNVKENELQNLEESLSKIKEMYDKDMQVLLERIDLTDQEMEKLFRLKDTLLVNESE